MPRLYRTLPVLSFLIGGLLLVSGCANTNNSEEDTRGGSILILDSLTGEDDDAFILSDVCDGDIPGFCSVVNDNAEASFRNEQRAPNTTTGSSFYQDITLYRYRVTYTRSDGRNTQGVDVPYAFDSVMNATVEIDGELETGMIVVRHAAKEERPLIDLRGIGDEFVLSTNTRVDFWGRDVAGNEHHVYGWIDIEFADYAEDE